MRRRRSSPTGEGLFLFNTTEAQSIYSKIRVVTQRMADARRIASRSLSRVSSLLTNDKTVTNLQHKTFNRLASITFNRLRKLIRCTRIRMFLTSERFSVL